jgi:hypothetical protein
MPLRIQNDTRWSTRDLKRFFTAGLKALGASTDKTIRVKYARGPEIHGCASYPKPWEREGSRITMKLPGPKTVALCQKIARAPIDYKKLAQIFEHEVGHNLDLRHRDMINWWTLEPTWQEGLTIAWEGTSAGRLTPDDLARRREAAKTAREAHARAMLKRAETRLARAKTITARWRARVTRYEKLAAARPLAKAESPAEVSTSGDGPLSSAS